MRESGRERRADRVARKGRVKRRLVRFLPALALAALAVAGLIWAMPYLSLEQLQQRHQALQAVVVAHPRESLLCYVGVAALMIALSLPGSLIVTFAGGYLFGAWEGAAAAVVGETIGAILMYLAARSAFGNLLRRRARVGGLVHRLTQEAGRNAFSYLLTLRLIPGVPFFLVNVAAGLVPIRISTYVAATVAGITPSTLIYTSVGSGLGRIFDQGGAPDLRRLLRPDMLLPVVGLAVLAIAPVGYHAWRRRSQADGP